MYNPRTRDRVVVASLALVAVTVAACGNVKEDGSGTPSSVTPSVAVDTALAAKVPEEIKADGTIKVGTDSSYAPGSFLATDGTTVTGFDIDLFRAVAAKLGLKADFESAKFDSIIPGVQSGKYEIGVSQFTINDERTKVVNMVSYFSAGTQWATRKGNPAAVSAEDACGKKIAVGTGSTQETDDLPVRQKACSAAGKPAIIVDSYQGQDQATAAVVTGKEDAMLADSPISAYAVQQAGGQLELLGPIYDSAPYGYVVRQDQAVFAEALRDAVKALIADGTYGTVLQPWGVQGGAITDPAVKP